MLKLSVIIPTRNRSTLLHNTLGSITRQTLPASDFEVIVVDNGSTDDTRIVVEGFAAKLPNLIYCYDETPGLHVGRHRGLRESSTSLLVYADDDIEAFPSWLEGVLESFDEPDVVLVGGKNLPKFESPPPDWLLSMWQKKKTEGRILSQLSILDLGEKARQIPPNLVFGCNFAIRKSILLDVGGFHPDGMPAELIQYRGDGENAVTEEIRKRGLKAFYNPKASVYHTVPQKRMTVEYFQRRAFLQGISLSYSWVRAAGGINKQLYLRIVAFLVRGLLTATIRKVLFRKEGRSFLIYWGYSKGVRYHQKQLGNDPELICWVCKKNYIDY